MYLFYYFYYYQFKNITISVPLAFAISLSRIAILPSLYLPIPPVSTFLFLPLVSCIPNRDRLDGYTCTVTTQMSIR